MHYRKKRTPVAGIVLAIAAILLFAGVLFLIENKMKVREGKGDSGKWGSGISGKVTLTIDDKQYSYTDDVDVYLIIGTDGTGSKPGGKEGFNGDMADFLMLAAINNTTRTYGFYQLDRDTITDVPILDENGEELGTAEEQLCIAHWYGYNEEQRNTNTVNTVSRLLGNLPIKGYYSINMDDVSAINHAVGGVTVKIEEDMTSVDPQMKQGAEIRLRDDQVEKYLRARMNVGDGTNTARMKRQRQYMQNAYSIVLQKLSEDPNYADTFYDELSGVITSDLPKKEASTIAASIREADSIGFMTFDGEHTEGHELDDGQLHNEFYISPDSIVENLQKLLDLAPE